MWVYVYGYVWTLYTCVSTCATVSMSMSGQLLGVGSLLPSSRSWDWTKVFRLSGENPYCWAILSAHGRFIIYFMSHFPRTEEIFKEECSSLASDPVLVGKGTAVVHRMPWQKTGESVLWTILEFFLLGFQRKGGVLGKLPIIGHCWCLPCTQGVWYWVSPECHGTRKPNSSPAVSPAPCSDWWET